MITAKIILDSINPANVRLTTFELTYPRFIHSEVMTYRMFSRNAASSRAIPITTMMDKIYREPATPEFWAKNQKGMQAAEELEGALRTAAYLEWIAARDAALGHAKRLQDLGVHKAIVNRILEPFCHITTVLTATSWNNMYAQRAHKDAQQEFQVLAFRMLNAFLKNTPIDIAWGEWHSPYLREEDYAEIQDFDSGKPYLDELAKVSGARCSRVSYLTHDGVRDIGKDFDLFDKLASSAPIHASGLEHPSKAVPPAGAHPTFWAESPSNFHPSWRQLRKTLPMENITELDLAAVLANKPDWITL